MNKNLNIPLVSICCITYNHEKYIRDCIEGFLMQKTSFPVEIIIHDDASTDSTQDIIRQYTNKDNRIIPILRKQNIKSTGVAVFPITYQRARGKYIALCEGDDYWTDPLKLQKQVDYMEANPECSIIFHAAQWIFTDQSKSNSEERPLHKEKKVSPEDMICVSGGKIPTASMVFRKKFINNYPDFLRSINGDEALVLLMSNYGHGYYFDEAMSVHLKNVPGSWTMTTRSNKTKMAENILAYARVLEEYNEYSNYKFMQTVNRLIAYNYLTILFKHTVRKVKITSKAEIINNIKKYRKYLRFHEKALCLILRTL